jgi:hypothetical protein
MHSSRNSRVKCGSFVASFSDTSLMKIVLLEGMLFEVNIKKLIRVKKPTMIVIYQRP